uniref:Uncharacterized protein n=1 Tax=Knipowitschia caucasica TaxID=637954 RepID=A0AAV2LLD5_KNICA
MKRSGNREEEETATRAQRRTRARHSYLQTIFTLHLCAQAFFILPLSPSNYRLQSETWNLCASTTGTCSFARLLTRLLHHQSNERSAGEALFAIARLSPIPCSLLFQSASEQARVGAPPHANCLRARQPATTIGSTRVCKKDFYCLLSTHRSFGFTFTYEGKSCSSAEGCRSHCSLPIRRNTSKWMLLSWSTSPLLYPLLWTNANPCK